jgi:uncharacterized membrane protein (DUF2068 family)
METVREQPQTPDVSPPAAPAAEVPHHHFGLALIAGFKLIKGILLLLAAIGLLKCVHADLSATVEHWITVFRMDPDSRYFRWLLEKLGAISPGELRAVSLGSFFYSALLLTEGVGLWYERRWAEYLTVIATSSFIPLEVYELCKKFNNPRIVVLVINLAILLYLLRVLRRERKPKASPTPPPEV